MKQEFTIINDHLNFTQTLPGHEVSVPFQEIDLIRFDKYETIVRDERERFKESPGDDAFYAGRPSFMNSEDPYVRRRIADYCYSYKKWDEDHRRHALYQLINIANLEKCMQKIAKVHSPDLEQYLGLVQDSLFECMEDLDAGSVLYTCEDACYTLEMRFSTDSEKKKRLDAYEGVPEMLEGRHGKKGNGACRTSDLDEAAALLDLYGPYLWTSKSANAERLKEAIHAGRLEASPKGPEPAAKIRHYF
jgi:hypothetical protein